MNDPVDFKCPESMRSYQRAKQKIYRTEDPDRYRGYRYKRNYGIGLVEYKAMFEAQGGLCAVCKRENDVFLKKSGARKNLSVDHDHSTGKIRGLLCERCNHSLGKLREDFDIIINLAKYVQEHKGVI